MTDTALTVMTVATRHPQDYVLVNEADGTRWRGTAAGRWVRADEQWPGPDPANPGWCASCTPDNCPGCGGRFASMPSGVKASHTDQRQVRKDSQGLGEPGRLSPSAGMTSTELGDLMELIGEFGRCVRDEPTKAGAVLHDIHKRLAAALDREARHTTQCKRCDNNCGAVHPGNCPDCPFRTTGVKEVPRG